MHLAAGLLMRCRLCSELRRAHAYPTANQDRSEFCSWRAHDRCLSHHRRAHVANIGQQFVQVQKTNSWRWRDLRLRSERCVPIPRLHHSERTVRDVGQRGPAYRTLSISQISISSPLV